MNPKILTTNQYRIHNNGSRLGLRLRPFDSLSLAQGVLSEGLRLVWFGFARYKSLAQAES
jgi:hypothetical protein